MPRSTTAFRYLCIQVCILTLAFAGLGKNVLAADYSPDIEEVLTAAGENRGELEKVIEHYSTSGDSLKLRAAQFLIENMEGHCYVTFALRDTSGNDIDLNVLDFPDFQTLIGHCEALEEERGTLDFEKDEKIEDLETITADFLIDQIDWAFRAWREKPWARDLNFAQFCQYVLPYRGSNEPLESWRKPFWKKYQDIEKQLDDPADPIQAAALINDDIKSWFRFDERYYLHPTDQGLAEMMDRKMGRCEDMTNLTIFAMRANGLAVTSDYTPFWANIGNNHAWNAIVKPDGEVIPFMGAEANPGKYRLSYKLAKAYRKTYAEQTSNLIFQERKQEDVPRWLAGKNYIDVTPSYTEVSDVIVEFGQYVPDTIDVAYLCVFNSGSWQAIDWGWVKSNKALFTDIGRDIAYLPALYIDKEIIPWSAPFLLTQDGQQVSLEPSAGDRIDITVNSTTRRIQDQSTEGMEVTYLAEETEYELFFWRDEWVAFGTLTAGDKPLRYNGVPSGALYWLKPVGSEGTEERIFTIANGQQVWW